VAVLAVLEVSLSFDNAVINATVLCRMNAFWQKLFLTVGILIAVFGMRLLFPLLMVAPPVARGRSPSSPWPSKAPMCTPSTWNTPTRRSRPSAASSSS
jgi:hypothetical protein